MAGVRRFARRFGKHARAVVALVSGQEVDRPRAVADASGRFSFEDPMVEEHLRAEQRFDGVEALKTQIRADVAAARSRLGAG